MPRFTAIQQILLFAVMIMTPYEIEDGKEEGKTFVCWWRSNALHNKMYNQ